MDRYLVLALGVVCALAWNAFVWWHARRSVIGRHLVARGAVLLDAGGDEDLAADRIPGALRLSPEAVATACATASYRSASLEILPFAGAVVVCGRTDALSARVAGWMRDAGYRRVFDAGAASRW